MDSPNTRRRQVSRSQTVAGGGSYREPVVVRPRRSPGTLSRVSVVGTAHLERRAVDVGRDQQSPIQTRYVARHCSGLQPYDSSASMCDCFRPLPLPPMPPKKEEVKTDAMPIPAPRVNRHSYEHVLLGSPGNLTGEAQDEEDRYMLVEPSKKRSSIPGTSPAPTLGQITLRYRLYSVCVSLLVTAIPLTFL